MAMVKKVYTLEASQEVRKLEQYTSVNNCQTDLNSRFIARILAEERGDFLDTTV